MVGFGFFRERREGFAPRTPAAALRALGLGVVPEESFVYLSTSQKPLDEEPFDLDEIERVLARKDLDLETNILMKGILEKLVSRGEQETSLFGAEGINLLEARYVDRIEELRLFIKDQGAAPGAAFSPKTVEAMRRMARWYYELALLHGKTRSIKTFYLKEAYSRFRDSMQGPVGMTGPQLRLFVGVLVGLGMYDQAAHVIAGAPDASDPELLLLRAEVAYHRRDYAEVVRACRERSESGAAILPGERRLISYWLGKP